MDMPAQWAMGLLHGILPPSSIDFLNTHLLDASSPVQTIRRTICATISSAYPILAVLANKLTAFFFNSPDIVVLVAILALLLVAIQILNFTRRLVVSLTRLVFNLVFYAGLVGCAAVLYQRGLEATVRDAIFWGARVWGYLEGVKEVFFREYERYAEEEKARMRGGAGGRNGAGWR